MSDKEDEQDNVIKLEQHSLALELRSDPARGRGVFTKERLAKNTLVEISPVLCFNANEYSSHGKYTVLDHYTYCWQGGGYALALGLGSMFNHNSTPNVGFIRDMPNSLIRYVTLCDIEKDEELCISYGNNLWFEDSTKKAVGEDMVSEEEEEEALPFGQEEE